MIAGKTWRAYSAVLVLLAICSTLTDARLANCTVSPFNIGNQGIQYSANFSQISPCDIAQIRVSNLYVDGECIDDDCSLRANGSTCPDDTVYTELSTLISTDDPTADFTSGYKCTPSSNISYIYTNNTCAQLSASWIQLETTEDPADCYTYKAYNYGAAIGIIVAVVICLALLIGGWIFWYRRRSRQGVYEPHHDMQMQPYSDSAAGQAYNDQGYSSSSLPAQQTSSTDRMHPGYPAAGLATGNIAQGTPVYPPWTSGGFKPGGGSTTR